MTDVVDLRSDTLTKPSPGMRRAMAEAVVGDDVFGEDPTVNELQEKAAALLGHEAALFVPSGTMANQVALNVLTRPGEEVIVEAGAHTFMYEAAAASVISSVQYRPLPGRRGLITAGQVEEAVRPVGDPHQPPTRVVGIENTHNRGGGTVYPLETIAAIRAVADRHGLLMHMDGARLFNACRASGLAPAAYARHFETVSFCLSKGLGAPVGSLLVSSRDRINRALRVRKMLGGGMRQVGILAAAGLYALEHNVDRLGEDHDNAQVLARGLAAIEGLEIDPAEVETNIVIFRVTRPGLDPAGLCAHLATRGVLVLPFGPDRIRAVTHLDVDRAGVERAVETAAEVLRQ
ncbi:MAG: low-specificity L-threonine aldolase [Thermodesulfobacteriota bacterium]